MLLSETPGVARSASSTVSIAWSCMRSLVTTLTDCGVSRIESGRPVAVDVASVV